MVVFVFNHSVMPLADITRQLKVTVWSRLSDNPAEAVQQLNFRMFDRVQAIILEIAHPVDPLFYILAQAIILQKPTLCLYPRHQEPREVLAHLSKKNIPKTIRAQAYTQDTIKGLIKNFVNSIKEVTPVEHTETPQIKFTLRLTPSLEHYLEWLAKVRGINKAEYLRELLQQQMNMDAHFQQYRSSMEENHPHFPHME